MTDDAKAEVERRHGRLLYVDPVMRGALGAAVGMIAGTVVMVLEPAGLSDITFVVLMVGGWGYGAISTHQKNKEMSREYHALKGDDVS